MYAKRRKAALRPTKSAHAALPPKKNSLCAGCVRRELIHLLSRYLLDRVTCYDEKALRAFDFSATLQPRLNSSPHAPLIDLVYSSNTKFDVSLNDFGVQFATQTLRTCVTQNLTLDADLLNGVHQQLALGFEYNIERYDDATTGYRKQSRNTVYHPFFSAEVFAWRANQPDDIELTHVLQKFPHFAALNAMTLRHVTRTDAKCMQRLLVRDRGIHNLRQRHVAGELSNDKYKLLRSRLVVEKSEQLLEEQTESVRRNLFLAPSHNDIMNTIPNVFAKIKESQTTLRTVMGDMRHLLLHEARLATIVRNFVSDTSNAHNVSTFAQEAARLFSKVPLGERSDEFAALPYFLTKLIKIEDVVWPHKKKDVEQMSAEREAEVMLMLQQRCTAAAPCTHDTHAELKLLDALRKLCVCMDVVCMETAVSMAEAHQLLASLGPWTIGTGGVARFVMNVLACGMSLPPFFVEPSDMDDERQYGVVTSFALQHGSTLLFACYLLENMRLQMELRQSFHMSRLTDFVHHRYGTNADATDVLSVLVKKWVKSQGERKQKTSSCISFGVNIAKIVASRSRVLQFMFATGENEKLYDEKV